MAENDKERFPVVFYGEATRSDADELYLKLLLGGQIINLTMVMGGEAISPSVCYEYMFNTKNQPVTVVTEKCLKAFMISEGTSDPIAATQSQVLMRTLEYHFDDSHDGNRSFWGQVARSNPDHCDCPLRHAYVKKEGTLRDIDYPFGIDPMSLVEFAQMSEKYLCKKVDGLGNRSVQRLKRMAVRIVADYTRNLDGSS